MKMKQARQALKDMSLQELHNKRESLATELLNLRLNVYTAQVKDYSRLAKVRREIARIATISRQLVDKKNRAAMEDMV